MKSRLAVLSSNSLNKYNFYFAISALEGAIWQRALKGIPVHLGHDIHKPIGWIIPYGLYFQPNLVRLLGRHLIPESENEQKLIYKHHRAYFMSLTADEVKEHESDFLKFVGDHLSENSLYLNAGAFSVVDDNIVEKLFPKLASLKVKDDLIPINDLLNDFSYKKQGVFFHNKLPICIYAHPYFRRSLSRLNNFHFIFLDELMSHANNTEINIKIALDWDMVGYSPTFLESQELEYWYGPKYNDDISMISPGLARHQSNEMERVFSGISSTEFFWKDNDDLHEFELEELKEDPTPGLTDIYSCRYIHSIFNKSSKLFQHFDGAIRSYDSLLYFERIDKKMTEFGRRSQYSKIFRMDGKITINDWKSLSTNYLQDNPLIHEYFGESRPQENYLLKSGNATVSERLIPFSMNAQDGIRMIISYHEKNIITSGHAVSSWDSLQIGEAESPFLEYDIIEVKKALERLGATLVFPDKYLLGAVEDLYSNIPCIFHGDENCQANLDITLKALSNILSSLVKKSSNRVISFNLAWNVEDKEVRISIMGHVLDLNAWLVQNMSIPVDHEGFVKWLEQQSKYLGTLKVPNPYWPNLDELAQCDGILYIKRRRISEERYSLTLKMTKKGVEYTMAIPQEEDDLLHAYNKNEVKPVIAVIFKNVLCSKTQENYFDSPHSSILDEDVSIIVKDFQYMGSYWTDKPA